jgi:hypothetical protein
MWTVESFTGDGEDLNQGQLFGNLFKVCILLRYRPAAPFEMNAGFPFVETPKLQWFEQIYFRDHQLRRCWQWSGDLYQYRPDSQTFRAWRLRYVAAYDTAVGQRNSAGFLRGVVELRDANGAPIVLRGQDIPNDGWDKAHTIRNLIRRIECQLYIEIHDVPSIVVENHVPGNHVQKERLLLFDCGMEGRRIQASQYLRIDTSQAQQAPEREFRMFWTRTDLPIGKCRSDFAPNLYDVNIQPVPPILGEYP